MSFNNNMLRLHLINLIIFSMAVLNIQARLMRQDLISDGVDQPFESQLSLSSDKAVCYEIYSFLPCAYNTGGYIFQIIVYQYLLFTGEKLVTKGSDRLFQILGTGVYGASVFRILKVLPGLITMIVSGVISSKEKAETQVAEGVSVYAGTTIISLTLMWLMGVMFGRKEKNATLISTKQESSASSSNCLLFMESGITTDKGTQYTAGIMLLSLIPFVIVESTNVFATFLARRVVILIALIVSTSFLFAYFAYQMWHPWMQERSLEYTKYENLLAGFLHHVQRQAKGKLINEDGQPNLSVIKRLFEQIDEDADHSLTLKELEKLIREDINFGKHKLDKRYALSEIWKAFDMNNDGRIQEQEFIDGFTKYINQAKQLLESDDCTTKDILAEVIQSVKNKKVNERASIECVMSRILKHVQDQDIKTEQLVHDDGTPNIERIKCVFREYDGDHSNAISESELEKLIGSVKFGEILDVDRDDIVKKVIKDFDKDGNNMIDEEEFVKGVTKWLNKAIDVAKRKDAKCIDEFDKIMWKEVDKLVYEVGKNGGLKYKLLTWNFNKSLFQVVLGMLMLTFLAGPLTTSISQFSNAMGFSSSIVSFVIVPFALNIRRAILAIFPASQKSDKIASLTFSEIYSGVIMNNLMGLTTLLAIVYAKDLKWDYSAEVLIILMVCVIVGFFAFFRTTYPIWTCIVAFLLYPFALVIFYLLETVGGWN